MDLKGTEPVARIRAREGVVEVSEIAEQEAEIAELPQRSRSQLTIKEEDTLKTLERATHSHRSCCLPTFRFIIF
ncbi:hypothetical protein F2Q69_00054482 [Brassica cretica]|uniref:Uncharacterized protein n=1 Tax=Brassica cretica TaxID=69181 RepID=A0A8S9MYH6_BRACR|nr:hypothetical protein F2Q69_00054482 [Brassica cretica]